MISRRNIRVKSMQALYACSHVDMNENPSPTMCQEEAHKQYQELINHFVQVIGYFTVFWGDFFLFLHQNVGRYAHQLDPALYDRFYDSACYKSLVGTDFYKKERKNMIKIIDVEWMRLLYGRMATSILEYPEYQSYMLGNFSGSEADLMKKIWIEIVEESPFWNEFMDEYIPFADCDDGILRSIVSDIFAHPEKLTLASIVPADKKKLGEDLLQTVLDKEEVITTQLKQKIQHWGQDRLLKIDAILLRLGVAELLFFDKIPNVVTINEYVDIAKMYSGKNSGLFINGILDAISKEAK